MTFSPDPEKYVLRLPPSLILPSGKPVFRPPRIPPEILESKVTELTARGYQTIEDVRAEYRVNVREVPGLFEFAVEIRPVLTLHTLDQGDREDYLEAAGLMGRFHYLHLSEFLQALTPRLTPAFEYLVPWWQPSRSRRPSAQLHSVYQPQGPWRHDRINPRDLRAAASATFRRHGSKLRDHTERLVRLLPRLESMTFCIEYVPRRPVASRDAEVTIPVATPSTV